jgi:hypothetical protein
MSRRREELAPGKPNVIVFESYVASGDDATVHLDFQSEPRLSELEAITRKLSSGEIKILHLSEMEDAHWVPPLTDVVLTVSTRSSDSRNRRLGEQVVCEWTETVEGWLESTEKIAVMRTSATPCHQYFGGPHADSVTIELAYRE